MNNPRVNLLKKNEQRYQGAVSRRFMLISMVITPILFIAILSGVKLIQYSGVQSDLKASRDIWVDIKPRLALCQDQQRGLKMNQEIINLIDGWQDSQVSMEPLLSGIQSAIPENIQITRLSIRSPVNRAVYKNMEELSLNYFFILQGISQGRFAENSVIRLRKDLLKSEHMSSAFESVNLSSMRKRAGRDGENLREFSLEGLNAEEDQSK